MKSFADKILESYLEPDTITKVFTPEDFIKVDKKTLIGAVVEVIPP